MYKRVVSSLLVGMFCFDGVFSSDTPLKDSVNSGSEFKQPKNEPVSTDKSHPTETESFYADGDIPVDLTVQSKEQPKNAESNTNTDAKESSDSEDKESVWAESDDTSVASGDLTPPSNQLQKNKPNLEKTIDEK